MLVGLALIAHHHRVAGDLQQLLRICHFLAHPKVIGRQELAVQGRRGHRQAQQEQQGEKCTHDRLLGGSLAL
ncbi:hypothetical protein D3C71_2183490 [compost metagenome]